MLIRVPCTEKMHSGTRLISHSLQSRESVEHVIQEAPVIKAGGKLIRCFATKQGKNSSAQSPSSQCLSLWKMVRAEETPKEKGGSA